MGSIKHAQAQQLIICHFFTGTAIVCGEQRQQRLWQEQRQHRLWQEQRQQRLWQEQDHS